jgi:hypothetical protein
MDLDRHKLVSRHLGHCIENSFVQRGLANLRGHVFGHRPDRRNHLSSLFVKKFRVHETLIEAPSERGGELQLHLDPYQISRSIRRASAGISARTALALTNQDKART